MVTTIRVSIHTRRMLENEKKRIGARTLEEVIINLLKECRRRLIEEYFGIDQGKIIEFTEDDRLDSRI